MVIKQLLFDDVEYQELLRNGCIFVDVANSHKLRVGQDVEIGNFNIEDPAYLYCRVTLIDYFKTDSRMVKFFVVTDDFDCDRRSAVQATRSR